MCKYPLWKHNKEVFITYPPHGLENLILTSLESHICSCAQYKAACVVAIRLHST